MHDGDETIKIIEMVLQSYARYYQPAIPDESFAFVSAKSSSSLHALDDGCCADGRKRYCQLLVMVLPLAY